MQLTRSQKFEAFCYAYLTHHLKSKFGQIHKDWFSLIDNSRLAVAAPRNFAKTHLFSVFYPLYCLLNEPDEILVLLSADVRLGRENMRKIRVELESNADIIADYGSQMTESWTQDKLILANGNQVQMVSANGRIRGHRATRVIADDLEDPEAVQSDEQRIKLKKWFYEDVIYVPGPEGQIIFVGTLLHEDALLTNFISTPPPGWVSHRTPGCSLATHDDGTHEVTESFWPSRWSKQSLQERVDFDFIAFQHEVMCIPIPDAFKPFIKFSYYDILPNQGLIYTTTVDPAISDSQNADFFAIVTVGTDHQKNMYVAEVTRGHWQPNEGIDQIMGHINRWNPHTVGMETVAYQKMLKYALEDRMLKEKRPICITELQTSHAAKGKKQRIMALEPYVKTGKILFKEDQIALLNEARAFPIGKHDDCLDALAYQLQIAMAGDKEAVRNFPKYSLGWIKQQREKRGARERYQSRMRWHD